MNDRRLLAWISGGLAAILAALFGAWFVENFERRTEEVDAGYSAAARRNPFLAAERFLRRLRVPVESVAGRDLLRHLPPPRDTLVINGLGVLNAPRRADLHRWLEQGGRLVVEATRFRAEDEGPPPDDFLAEYGVRPGEIDEDQAPELDNDEVVAEVEMIDSPHSMTVGFHARYYLDDTFEEASAAVAAGKRYRLLQYSVGDGLLTVTSDNVFLTNPDIGRHDHALFLALLANAEAGGKVWLLYDSSMPWLGALLWQRFPLVVISVVCCLGATIWLVGGRLGPLLPRPERRRRDLMDNLQASAAFLWRHGHGSRLLAVTRERTEQGWLRRHPALRPLTSTQRAAWIGHRTGLPPARVERALYRTGEPDKDPTALGTLLQRLWAALSAHGSREGRE